MTQLDIIAEQVKNYIDTICSQYQFVLKGNIYLHTPHEEVNLQILPTIDFKQHSDRKLGGFYDILTDEMDDVTVKSETFIDFFETICQRKNIRKNTRISYTRTLATLKAYAPKALFIDIDKNFVEGYEQYLISLNMKNNTVLKNLKHLKKAINSAASQGYIQKTTKELFSLCTIRPEKCKKENLNHSEVLRLHNYLISNFHCLPDREKETLAAFLFSCYTGLRYSDLIDIQYSDFRKIKNKRWLSLRMKKTTQQVTIPVEQLFNGRALQVARLFHRTRGRLFYLPSNAICNRIIKRTYRQLSGKKQISFHTARHTAATLLLYYNVPLNTVQYILGHTSIRTTEIYAETNEATIYNALKGIRFKEFV